ncbi:MAG: TIGR03790 family protein [Verrucomicrobia bacterium]|nr:TIGR03790 family protein [Verrucomicrobiota bacterium]
MRRIATVLLMWICLSSWAMGGSPKVIVIANGNVPESLELAHYYLQARDLPTNCLCVLDLPDEEVISRGTYEEKLRDPLLKFLREGKHVTQKHRRKRDIKSHESEWETTTTTVGFMVSMYGIPLKISDTKTRLGAAVADLNRNPSLKNEAAVDSELAVMLTPPIELNGPALNPAYNRFSHADSGPAGRFLVFATRLDGPNPEDVKRMIDQSLDVEKYGLLGRAYFDARGLTLGNHFMGDYWIREACERFIREGFDCYLDLEEDRFSVSFPMEDAVVYLGWYTEDVDGPFTRTGFKLRPGAVAYHLHSGSAKSLKHPDRNWAAPLIECGAAATMGAVYEPYLEYTPNLQLFADRLCSGYSLAESAYMSMKVISWQITVVGDPLFRPFAIPLDEQIANLEKDGRKEVEWAYLRKINLYMQNGLFNRALRLCTQKAEELDSMVLREKLADLLLRNEALIEAGKQYEKLVDDAKTAETAVRSGVRLIAILKHLKKDDDAAQAEASIREKWAGSPALDTLSRADSFERQEPVPAAATQQNGEPEP